MRNRAFTLLEMIISMAIICIALLVVFVAYDTNIRMLSGEMNETDAAIELNKTMDRMTRDIRSSLWVVTTGTQTVTVWAYDLDSDGTYDASELVTYKWVGGTVDVVYRTVQTTNEIIGRYIYGMTATYDVTPGPSLVTISLTAKVGTQVSTLSSSVNLRNM